MLFGLFDLYEAWGPLPGHGEYYVIGPDSYYHLRDQDDMLRRGREEPESQKGLKRWLSK